MVPQMLTGFELDEINSWLKDRYGYFDVRIPNWRVVWSDDQMEYRSGDFHEFNKNGDLIRVVSGTRYVPKYSYIKAKYVLERMVPVADNNKELTTKCSYEPAWTFEDKYGKALPPVIGVCFYVIEQIHNQAAMRLGVKYKDPRTDKYWSEMKAEERKALYEQMFGNETNVTDALMQRSAVTVPDMSAVNKDS